MTRAKGDWTLGRSTQRIAIDVNALCREAFMKPARRIGFILAAMLMAISFAGASAIAQQDEAAVLNDRVVELYRAGK